MDPALEQSKPTSKWIFGTPISRMLASALAAGREILRQKSGADEMPAGPEALLKSCADLVEHRGEASGLALAEQILSAYEALSDEEKAVFSTVWPTISWSTPNALTRRCNTSRQSHAGQHERPAQSPGAPL